MSYRPRNPSDPPRRPPAPPWLAGAAIGMAIMTMASGAMMIGAGMGLALGQAGESGSPGRN
ncbi:MAG: hypothetical protein JO227_13015 [Acetobacteraceae bacterium]|nr:hypothetical protein [Acetobacteraceae bacterium]